MNTTTHSTLLKKHLSLPQYTVMMTDERCDSWHQTMLRNGTTLVLNKSITMDSDLILATSSHAAILQLMKSPCDTHIISSQPHLAPQILSHHMSKMKLALYIREHITTMNYGSTMLQQKKASRGSKVMHMQQHA